MSFAVCRKLSCIEALQTCRLLELDISDTIVNTVSLHQSHPLDKLTLDSAIKHLEIPCGCVQLVCSTNRWNGWRIHLTYSFIQQSDFCTIRFALGMNNLSDTGVYPGGEAGSCSFPVFL